MDQVITFIEKQLLFFQQVEEVKLITPSMINNYVKDNVVKHAVQKKYNKEHLASLVMLGLLKQVLPLSRIKEILSADTDTEALYDAFLQEQKTSLFAAFERVNFAINDNKEDIKENLFALALSLSAEAVACRIVAEKILNVLSESEKTKE